MQQKSSTFIIQLLILLLIQEDRERYERAMYADGPDDFYGPED